MTFFPILNYGVNNFLMSWKCSVVAGSSALFRDASTSYWANRISARCVARQVGAMCGRKLLPISSSPVSGLGPSPFTGLAATVCTPWREGWMVRQHAAACHPMIQSYFTLKRLLEALWHSSFGMSGANSGSLHGWSHFNNFKSPWSGILRVS